MSSFPIFAYLALAVISIMLERSLGVRDPRFRIPPLSDWSQMLVILPAGATFLMSFYEVISGEAKASVVTMVIGALLWVLAIAVRAKANIDVRQALSGVADPEQPMPLVKGGIYAQIRHPLLLSVLLLLVAWPLFLSANYAWVFSFVGLLGIMARVRIEEIAMMVRNEDYVAYRQSTWALIPRVY